MSQLATKCNLCAGYEDSNCVENCPTGAILRIEPTTYFKEVGALLGRGVNKAIGGKRTEEADDSQKERGAAIVIPAAAVLVAIGLGVFAWSAPMPLQTFSFHGYALGYIALFSMIGAIALAGRRRLARFRTQLGSYQTWTRAHIHIGALALLATLLHAGFRAGGFVTSL